MPAERVEDAARALARAAPGRPVRNLATTRAGTIQYFLARRSPRRLLDRITLRAVRRLVRSGSFAEGGLARDLAARLSTPLSGGTGARRSSAQPRGKTRRSETARGHLRVVSAFVAVAGGGEPRG